MNFLPTLLAATTIISSISPIRQDNIPSHVQSGNQNRNYIASGIITDNNCNLESVLNDFCINFKDIFNNCNTPSFPEIEVPVHSLPAPELPTSPLPDLDTPSTPEEVPIPDSPSDTTPDMTPDTVPGENNSSKPEQTPETDTDENITVSSYVKKIVALVNRERAKVNLPALTMSSQLNSAAQIRAVETTKSFSHTRPNGKSFASVLTENNISYRSAGENIAWGQKTPEEVVNAWMNSSGHRANILNENYTAIGVGYSLKGSTPYWAQLFTY